MIIALIILILLGGNFGASHLDLSDPTVLAEFRQNVFKIVPDPERAGRITNAVQRLNVEAYHGRSPYGVVKQEVQAFRSVAGNYNSTNEEVHIALRKLEHKMNNVSRGTMEGREIIRQNTSKSEWKKLLKQLSE